MDKMPPDDAAPPPGSTSGLSGNGLLGRDRAAAVRNAERFAARRWYIPAEWLKTVEGSRFFYPCSGRDTREPMLIFASVVKEFRFCDVRYNLQGLQSPVVPAIARRWKLIQSRTISHRHSAAQQEYHADIQPRSEITAERSELWGSPTGHEICIVTHRDSGLDLLQQRYEPASLGVFMHRGDSLGEGGSNLHFLGQPDGSTEKPHSLLEEVATRLADKALVISDGSNTNLNFLNQFLDTHVTGHEAWRTHEGNTYNAAGFRWTCVGWMKRRYGPTLVWGVTRESASPPRPWDVHTNSLANSHGTVTILSTVALPLSRHGH